MDSIRERRIIVTGGSGFIGRHLVRALAMQGQPVAIVCTLSSDLREDFVAAVPAYKVDIRDKLALTAAFQDFMPTHVIHLAGDSSSRIGGGDLTNLVDTNVIGSINVVDASTSVGAKKFIFASTAGVYGEVEDGTKALESDPFNPVSEYAESKASFELFMRAFNGSNRIQTVVLRLANVYGPRHRASVNCDVVSIFAEKLLRRQPIALYSARVEGDGGCSRNFVYIDDVVAAMLRSLDEDMEGTFNVATNEVSRTVDVLDAISKAVGIAAELSVMPPRDGEIKRSTLDCSRLMSTGWWPKVSIGDGIARTVAHIRNQAEEISPVRV